MMAGLPSDPRSGNPADWMNEGQHPIIAAASAKRRDEQMHADGGDTPSAADHVGAEGDRRASAVDQSARDGRSADQAGAADRARAGREAAARPTNAIRWLSRAAVAVFEGSAEKHARTDDGPVVPRKRASRLITAAVAGRSAYPCLDGG